MRITPMKLVTENWHGCRVWLVDRDDKIEVQFEWKGSGKPFPAYHDKNDVYHDGSTFTAIVNSWEDYDKTKKNVLHHIESQEKARQTRVILFKNIEKDILEGE